MGAIPPTGLLLLAIVSIQLGAAVATHLFPILGAEGTVAIRIIISALLLGLVARGKVRRFASLFVRDWGLLLAYGLSGHWALPRWLLIGSVTSPAWGLPRLGSYC